MTRRPPSSTSSRRSSVTPSTTPHAYAVRRGTGGTAPAWRGMPISLGCAPRAVASIARAPLGSPKWPPGSTSTGLRNAIEPQPRLDRSCARDTACRSRMGCVVAVRVPFELTPEAMTTPGADGTGSRSSAGAGLVSDRRDRTTTTGSRSRTTSWFRRRATESRRRNDDRVGPRSRNAPRRPVARPLTLCGPPSRKGGPVNRLGNGGLSGRAGTADPGRPRGHWEANKYAPISL